VSWKPTRWHFPAATLAAAAIVCATIYFVAADPGQPAPTDSRPVVTSSQPPGNEYLRDQSRVAQADTVSARVNASTPAVDPEASTIAQYTSEKYQLLLDELHHLEPGQAEKLRQALFAREQLAGAPETAERNQALAKVEDQIRGMLNPADHATYQMLKESDLELYKLNEYAGGVTNVAPLSPDDRKSILRTKLAYKERYRQLLRDSGLQRNDLSAAEREYAYSVTSRAMEDYKRSYLQEVRQYLANDEQYALLSNYETTEFDAELVRLRSMVDGISRGGS
jgi:hypothetical protein